MTRLGPMLLVLATVACGGGAGGQDDDAGAGPVDGGPGLDASAGDAAGEGGDADAGESAADAAVADAALADAAFSGVIDVVITVADTCAIDLDPASITVPTGTEFTVNWINAASSASEIDVDKVDDFNQVPILIDLAPGESYHDDIRAWCGDLFTGTFAFRITGCFDPVYLDVDCGA